MVLGSGPIVIGQACEFDYSGTQACRALRAEGARVVLVNSNPATIMTDPSVADRSYIEPLTLDAVTAVIEREKPDALLPTMGGQTALNLAMRLHAAGVLQRHEIELLGASIASIELAEDRQKFSVAMAEIGLATPRSTIVENMSDADRALDEVGLPVIVRPSFTLGGAGGGMAYNRDEFRDAVFRGLEQSPLHQVLVEQSIAGWKEYELEVMRDRADNVVIVCSIENLDPMGVHTGDSITVAPAQTLTDREYQRMRDAALRVIRRVGVATGGSNIQFAVNPKNGELHVIEMNPRVSRSSALASKATGFPIAKIAARLALGTTLDQITNDITRSTLACFEPVLDYVVVKIPRFDLAKFPGASDGLGPQMKSIGEVMAIGRTFAEAFRKGLASLDHAAARAPLPVDDASLGQPSPTRVLAVIAALRAGRSVDEVHQQTRIDPWFLHQFANMLAEEARVAELRLDQIDAVELSAIKRHGLQDAELARLWSCDERRVRQRRRELGVQPSFLRVDTCAGEFESHTPYLYSSYESRCEAAPTGRRKVMILGSGANRIGQGIEFDYCCCHAAFALRARDVETLLVNCNPETVSTDYDTADRLYFEPLRAEQVLAIAQREQVEGVIVQLGGQTPLKLARELESEGLKILGTSTDALDLAEDRERFGALLADLDIRQPRHGMARGVEQALQVAEQIGYPVLLRPSYVLGGQSMRVLYGADGLRSYLRATPGLAGERPVLIDQFLEDAYEYDVDALADGEQVLIAGVLQHVEEAGVHSGDSAAFYPPFRIKADILDQIRDTTRRLGLALGVRGLMNIQFAEHRDQLHVLEVNPRASRTVPFLAKATGQPFVQQAVRIMMGDSLAELGLAREPTPRACFAKVPVFVFDRFPGADVLLGPEMRSTGEVMGVGATPGEAFLKGMLGAGQRLPKKGAVFVSVNDNDKDEALALARRLHELGFTLLGSRGTALHFFDQGLPAQLVFKVNEGRPNITDLIRSDEVQMVINTPLGRASRFDEKAIRMAAARHGVPRLSTLSTLSAAHSALEAIAQSDDVVHRVRSLQELHEGQGPL